MKLHILMSTYNGETYLPEQLDSLLSQTLLEKEGWEVRIVVRDDGSTDSTCHILQSYAKKDGRIRYEKGENKGVIESFFDLVDAAGEADYLAFCDQDDVWMPEKLERAVGMLAEREGDSGRPLLYCGRPLLTDGELKPIKTVWLGEGLRPSFGNALIENICVGCTCVINRALADLLRLGRPSFTLMHDRWCYLLASCFGEVIYDTETWICYRQHGKNVVGMKKNHFRELAERIGNYRRKRGGTIRQAEAFLEFCERFGLAIPKKKRALVYGMANLKKNPGIRLRLVRSKALYRQRRGDNLLFKLLILLGEG